VGDKLLTLNLFKCYPWLVDLRGQTRVYLHQCRWLLVSCPDPTSV